jgi:hypothetical protein
MPSSKSRSFEPVDLDGGANGNVAQFVGFLEKGVHSAVLHQANEENEEFCRAPPPAPDDNVVLTRMQVSALISRCPS